MLFWNTLYQTKQKNYICWICLEEEKISNSSINAKWIKHSCGCNLQIHKLCYLKYLNNLIDKSYMEEIYFNTVDHDSTTTIYDLSKIYLFDFIDTNKKIAQESSIVLNIFPKFLKHLLNGYLYRIRLPLNLLNPYPLEGYLDDNLQDLHKLPNIPKNRCPQCNKTFMPSNTHFIEGNSSLLSIYFKIQKIIQNLVPTGLTIATLSNPTKILFKLGLYLLRTLFPESILKIILNISSTKALDIYSETSNGLRSISNFNKFLIFGLPIYMVSLVCTSVSPSDLPSTPLDEIQLIYPLLLSIHVKSYEGAPKNTISLISICLLISKITIMVYKRLLKPWFHEKFYNRWLYKNQESFEPNFKVFATPTYKSSADSHGGIILQCFFDYYYSITTFYDEIFRALVLWPNVAKLFSNKVLIKLMPWLYSLQYKWLLNASPDEVKMYLNFFSYATTGVTYSLFNLWLSNLRIEEINRLNRLLTAVTNNDE